ncbi:MAG: GNAT family N-acetyltransferase [Anaerolineae bacterium]
MSSKENPSIILETERLILRRQRASDIASLTDLWADPKVTRYMGGPRDRDWLQSVFEETAQNPYAEQYDLWPVVEKETGQVVGHCGLLDKEVEGRTEIELNYILSPSVWGKGYATEIGQAIKQLAFEKMGVERLIALIEPENEASERVAVKIGMRLEKEVVRPGGALRKVYAIDVRDERKAANMRMEPTALSRIFVRVASLGGTPVHVGCHCASRAAAELLGVSAAPRMR